jgi:16S rRNA (uracil1498-N3)-methyltransferase
MTLRLFVDEPLQTPSQEIVPSVQQQHYLLHVMRLQEQSPVSLFNGKDGEWEAKCLNVKKSKKMRLQLLGQTRTQPLQTHSFFLFFAPLKIARMEMLIEKATELGGTHFIPCITERTTLRTPNLDRLQRISLEACEQSQRLDIPQFYKPAPLSQQLAEHTPSPHHLFLMIPPSQHIQPPPLLHALQTVFSDTPSTTVGVLIGPEGGWSEKELRSFQQSTPRPLIPASLGTQILRAETAGCLALGILNHYSLAASLGLIEGIT